MGFEDSACLDVFLFFVAIRSLVLLDESEGAAAGGASRWGWRCGGRGECYICGLCWWDAEVFSYVGGSGPLGVAVAAPFQSP